MNLSKITTIFLTILYSTFASISQAATLIYDEDVFYSIYEAPSEIIDFTTLKDGTIYSKVLSLYQRNLPSSISPYLVDTYSSAGHRFGVRENGWSDGFLFKGEQIITRWNGDSIIADFFPLQRTPFLIHALDNVTPIALSISSSSYTGFLGIVPDSLTDNYYNIPYENVILNDFKSGFTIVSTVPLPSALIFFLSGLLAIFTQKQSKVLSINTQSI